MDDFLANKIIEDLIRGTMTAQEAWTNLQECQNSISDEKYDEITALLTEQLIEAEMVNADDEVELEDIFEESHLDLELDFDWDEPAANWGFLDFED